MRSARAPLQTEAEIMDAALSLLSRREYSEAELTRKLLEKTEQQHHVESVLARVQEFGYQNDRRYTESYIRYGISQGKGESWIIMKLRQKGVPPALIEACLCEADPCWQDLALAQLERKFKNQGCDLQEKARWYRFLASRGFNPDAISAAVEHHAQNQLDFT